MKITLLDFCVTNPRLGQQDNEHYSVSELNVEKQNINRIGRSLAWQCNVLCSVKRKLEVVSSVGWVQLTVVERLRSEVVNQSTECHSVVPACREVRYIHMLTHTHLCCSSSQCYSTVAVSCSVKPKFHMARHVTSRHARHVVTRRAYRIGLLSEHAHCQVLSFSSVNFRFD